MRTHGRLGGPASAAKRATRPALALLLLALAALSLSPMRQPARPSPLVALLARQAGELGFSLVEFLMAFAVGPGIAAFLVLALIERGARDKGLSPRFSKARKWAFMYGLIGLALMGLLPLGMAGVLEASLPEGVPEAGPPPASAAELALAESTAPSASDVAAWRARSALALAFLAGGAILALAATIAIVRSSPRRGGMDGKPDGDHGGPGDLAGTGNARLGTFGGARRLLETGDSVRDAVIAAWAAMCDFLPVQARSDAAATPRELCAALLARGAERGPVEILTRIFERARYSEEILGEGDRAAAVAALRALEPNGDGQGGEP